MKNQALNAVIAGVFGLASAQAMATGFVNLPTTGFTVSGGTSAYTPCNTTGGFGQTETTAPTTSANNTCAIFPSSSNSPGTGYTKILDTTRTVNMNNSYTGNTNKYVLDFYDQVWWKNGTTEYVFVSKHKHKNIDYDTTQGGTQYFEVNDFQRAGFSGRTTDVAYFFQAGADEAIFRAGRTKTGVATEEGGEAQPLTSEAPIDVNWVDFMTDTNWDDDDGTSLKDSPWTYIKVNITTKSGFSAGDTGNIQTLSGAVQFFQAGQEGQPLITVPSSAYAPWDANAN